MHKTMPIKNVWTVDVGGSQIRAALVDGQGHMQPVQVESTAASRSVAEVVAQLAAMMPPSVDAVSVAIPGFLDPARASILHSPNFPGWHNVAIRKLLRQRLLKPVTIINDADAYLLGEYWRGAGQVCSHWVGLTLGTGVGGAVLIDGKLLSSAYGAAAELGHMVVDPQGALCGCGARGCLEVCASATALQRLSGVTAEQLAQQAAQGDTAALEHFERLGFNLGQAIASICQIFSPHKVILGGRLSLAYPYFAESLQTTLAQRLQNHPSRQTVVQVGDCIDTGGLLGAAYLAIHERSIK